MNMIFVGKVRKVLILFSIFIVFLAILLTCICKRYDSAMVVMGEVIDIFSFMPLDRWTSSSSFSDVAAVYYLFCSPLILLFFLLNWAYVMGGGRTIYERNAWVVFIKSIFLLFFSFLLLVLFDGDGYWKYRIGENFWLLLATGWVHMALPGWLLGESLRPIFFHEAG